MRDLMNMIAAFIFLFIPSLIILIACITYSKSAKSAASRLMLWGSILGIIAAFDTFGATWIYPPPLEATSAWKVHQFCGVVISFIGGLSFSVGFFMLIKGTMTQQRRNDAG